MSRGQMHGKFFENVIKGVNNGIFNSAASDRRRTPNEKFDIDAEDDMRQKIPTQIKTSGTSTIALSDARAFWDSLNHAPYRIIIGRYRQLKGVKEVYEIIECIIDKHHRSYLLGTVTEDEVTNFHNEIRAFSKGPEQAALARNRASEILSELKPRLGVVGLNPKIDSRNQRRLQCSLGIKYLEAGHGGSTKSHSLGSSGTVGGTGAKPNMDLVRHKKSFGLLSFPLIINSETRR